MRKQLVQLLHAGVEPFQDFTPDLTQCDPFGWNSTHHMLKESVDAINPKIIIDAGVWMGGSCIHLAKIAPAAQVLAIDTFLGCDILRLAGYTLPMLKVKHGRPTYFETFYANVFKEGLQNQIIPLHMDTRSGLRFLRRQGVQVDLIHHDATHYHPDVYEDLNCCWEILRPGGHLIIDDYERSPLRYPQLNDFNGLCDDVDRFVSEKNLTIEASHPKCRLIKPL